MSMGDTEEGNGTAGESKLVGQVIGLHHVQLLYPQGKGEETRRFYAAVLGLRQIPRPAVLEGENAGFWFALGDRHLHLSEQDDFSPMARAHPALLVDDLAAMRRQVTEAGVQIKEAVRIPDWERFYIFDPFGNRIELMQTP